LAFTALSLILTIIRPLIRLLTIKGGVMPKDTLDIIDTAVKIGLGAIISGVSTYFITSKNHSVDKSNKQIDKRIEILEFATESIEPHLNTLRKYVSKVDGSLRHGIPSGDVDRQTLTQQGLLAIDNDFVDTREKKSIAISRLKLIGENEIISKLSVLTDLGNDFREELIFKKVVMSPEELEEFCTQLNIATNSFYHELQIAFERTYGLQAAKQVR